MKRYFITGAPGTGKSSVSEKLKSTGYYIIDLDRVEDRITHWRSNSTSEISHWYSGASKDFFENNSYLVDIDKLKQEMGNQTNIVIVAGVADNQKDFLNLFEKVFLLQADEKTFINRIKAREKGEFGNDKSEREMVRGWYKSLEREMLEKGAIPISTENSIDHVTNEIITNINN